MNSWEQFFKHLLIIRRSSIKDKYALTLLTQLDSTYLNGGEPNGFNFKMSKIYQRMKYLLTYFIKH